MDSRRAIRYVRHNAEKYGVDKNKVAIMGSSAGGHLSAMTSTYYEPIEFEDIDEIDNEKFIPDAQILCYPVISAVNYANRPSFSNLFGQASTREMQKMSLEFRATSVISDLTLPPETKKTALLPLRCRCC